MNNNQNIKELHAKQNSVTQREIITCIQSKLTTGTDIYVIHNGEKSKVSKNKVCYYHHYFSAPLSLSEKKKDKIIYTEEQTKQQEQKKIHMYTEHFSGNSPPWV